jgi:hypothetical protein
MTGTNCDLFTHKSSRSYLNHLVYFCPVLPDIGGSVTLVGRFFPASFEESGIKMKFITEHWRDYATR